MQNFYGVLAAAVAWLLILGIDFADWELGIWRSLATLLLLGASLWYFRRPRPGFSLPRKYLYSLLALLLIWQATQTALSLQKPQIVDVGFTTLAAARALAGGIDLYKAPVAPLPEEPGEFNGFKYGPAMAAFYLPGTLLGDARGLLLTNFLLLLATTALIFLAANQSGGWDSGLFAAIFYLSLPLVSWELSIGVTDLLPTLPLFAAWFLADRMPLCSGGLLGFSLATKLVPAFPVATLLALPLLRAWDKKQLVKFFAGILLGAASLLFYVMRSPKELYHNLIEFQGTRPPDSTSWLYYLPEAYPFVAALFLFLVVYLHWKSWSSDTRQRAVIVVAAVLAGLLANRVNHRNYQLWWLPWFSVLLATAFFGQNEKARS